MKINVVGVRFLSGGRIYYFSPQTFKLEVGNYVIVETEFGHQLGIVESDIEEKNEKDLFLPLKNVIKKATEDDLKTYQKNIKDAQKALKYAKEIVDKNEIDMKIFDAEYSFDRKKLTFKFIADERVDFRDVAKELASKYKTRIELRQIGVRDKSKEIGGVGPCGRILCCNSFLKSFDSVSINMAKNQGIALNPTKINGLCGRLLCCLGYEDETYLYYKKKLPKIGEMIEKEGKKGRVIELNILDKSYKIVTSDDEEINIKEE